MSTKGPTIQTEIIWRVGIRNDKVGWPSIAWGIGQMQGEKSPLSASAMALDFVWHWPRQDPIHCLDADQILAQIASQGLSVPPRIYEVGKIMAEFRPKMRDQTFERKKEICKEIKQRWRVMLHGF